MPYYFWRWKNVEKKEKVVVERRSGDNLFLLDRDAKVSLFHVIVQQHPPDKKIAYFGVFLICPQILRCRAYSTFQWMRRRDKDSVTKISGRFEIHHLGNQGIQICDGNCGLVGRTRCISYRIEYILVSQVERKALLLSILSFRRRHSQLWIPKDRYLIVTAMEQIL